jgi:RNA methyltransferase, TrmH family
MNEYPQLTKNQIKTVKSLHKKQGRDEQGLFIAEGLKICSELFNSDYDVNSVIIPGDSKSEVLELIEKLNNKTIFKVNRKIFNSLCDTKSPQDILAVAKIKENNILYDESFIALEGISDPGNVGTIIRTADWFGIKQIIMDNDTADVYNPKVVRATMGSVFRINTIRTDNLKSFIKNNFSEHAIIGTYIDEGVDIAEFKVPERYGIVFGGESKGISDELSEIVNQKIKIRRIGRAESLNVSVAAGIVMFETIERTIK